MMSKARRIASRPVWIAENVFKNSQNSTDGSSKGNTNKQDSFETIRNLLHDLKKEQALGRRKSVSNAIPFFLFFVYGNAHYGN